MKQPTLQDVLKSPLDFLYIFATDEFLSKIDSRSRKIITSKRANQMQLLRSVVGNNGIDSAAQQIASVIEQNFGYKPGVILMRLADGQAVAGKNWRKGIYGVGDAEGLSFVGTDISVDPDAGWILQDGLRVSSQTMTINEDGRSTYSATIDGKVYSSQVSGETYLAGTVVDSEGDITLANGTPGSLSNMQSIWEGINGFLPYIERLINFILSIFGGSNLSYINRSNTIPTQSDGFVDDDASIDWTSLGIFGGIAAAIYLLFDKKK